MFVFFTHSYTRQSEGRTYGELFPLTDLEQFSFANFMNNGGVWLFTINPNPVMITI